MGVTGSSSKTCTSIFARRSLRVDRFVGFARATQSLPFRFKLYTLMCSHLYQRLESKKQNEFATAQCADPFARKVPKIIINNTSKVSHRTRIQGMSKKDWLCPTFINSEKKYSTLINIHDKLLLGDFHPDSSRTINRRRGKDNSKMLTTIIKHRNSLKFFRSDVLVYG